MSIGFAFALSLICFAICAFLYFYSIKHRFNAGIYLLMAFLLIGVCFLYYAWVNTGAAAISHALGEKKVIGGTTPKEMSSMVKMSIGIFFFMCCLIPMINKCHPTSDEDRNNPIAEPLFMFAMSFFPGLALWLATNSFWAGLTCGAVCLLFIILIWVGDPVHNFEYEREAERRYRRY